jgi:hypothetical protein
MAFKMLEPADLAVRWNDTAQRRDVMECGTAKAVGLGHASMIASITMRENGFGRSGLIILRKFNNLCACMGAELMKCFSMCGQQDLTHDDPGICSRRE